MIDTPMPNSAPLVGSLLPKASTARQPIPAAEAVISMTWNSAASASALPCPKRWSWSAGCAASRTPYSVTQLASRSSPESARLPSIATEPVVQAA